MQFTGFGMSVLELLDDAWFHRSAFMQPEARPVFPQEVPPICSDPLIDDHLAKQQAHVEAAGQTPVTDLLEGLATTPLFAPAVHQHSQGLLLSEADAQALALDDTGHHPLPVLPLLTAHLYGGHPAPTQHEQHADAAASSSTAGRRPSTCIQDAALQQCRLKHGAAPPSPTQAPHPAAGNPAGNAGGWVPPCNPSEHLQPPSTHGMWRVTPPTAAQQHMTKQQPQQEQQQQHPRLDSVRNCTCNLTTGARHPPPGHMAQRPLAVTHAPVALDGRQASDVLAPAPAAPAAAAPFQCLVQPVAAAGTQKQEHWQQHWRQQQQQEEDLDLLELLLTGDEADGPTHPHAQHRQQATGGGGSGRRRGSGQVPVSKLMAQLKQAAVWTGGVGHVGSGNAALAGAAGQRPRVSPRVSTTAVPLADVFTPAPAPRSQQQQQQRRVVPAPGVLTQQQQQLLLPPPRAAMDAPASLQGFLLANSLTAGLQIPAALLNRARSETQARKPSAGAPHHEHCQHHDRDQQRHAQHPHGSGRLLAASSGATSTPHTATAAAPACCHAGSGLGGCKAAPGTPLPAASDLVGCNVYPSPSPHLASLASNEGSARPSAMQSVLTSLDASCLLSGTDDDPPPPPPPPLVRPPAQGRGAMGPGGDGDAAGEVDVRARQQQEEEQEELARHRHQLALVQHAWQQQQQQVPEDFSFGGAALAAGAEAASTAKPPHGALLLASRMAGAGGKPGGGGGDGGGGSGAARSRGTWPGLLAPGAVAALAAAQLGEPQGGGSAGGPAQLEPLKWPLLQQPTPGALAVGCTHQAQEQQQPVRVVGFTICSEAAAHL